MIRLLHGDNISASRDAFTKQKKESDNPVSLRGGSFTLTDLAQIFEGGELFASSKDVFIEDLFNKIKKGNELETLTAYLIKQAEENSITIWEGKVLTKTQIALLKNPQSQLFKLPTKLFSLLDALKPGNSRFLIAESHDVTAEIGEEILFSMITRHIRILLALKENSQIEEVKKLAPWQKAKMVQQASSFATEQLLELHSNIVTIDTSRKTGTNTLPLPASIDFLLLRI